MKKILTILYVCIALLITTGMVAAGASAERQKPDVATLLTDAERGKQEAQYYLGLAYLNGEGVEKNERTAVEYFYKAAQQGLPDALYNLAYCYEKGIGVPQNYQYAITTYQLAADRGDVGALAAAALCWYRTGDKGQAEKLWLEAAEKGSVSAMENLGSVYNSEGKKELAEKYWQMAADKGSQKAKAALGKNTTPQKQAQTPDPYRLKYRAQHVEMPYLFFALSVENQDKFLDPKEALTWPKGLFSAVIKGLEAQTGVMPDMKEPAVARISIGSLGAVAL